MLTNWDIAANGDFKLISFLFENFQHSHLQTYNIFIADSAIKMLLFDQEFEIVIHFEIGLIVGVPSHF